MLLRWSRFGGRFHWNIDRFATTNPWSDIARSSKSFEINLEQYPAADSRFASGRRTFEFRARIRSTPRKLDVDKPVYYIRLSHPSVPKTRARTLNLCILVLYEIYVYMVVTDFFHSTPVFLWLMKTVFYRTAGRHVIIYYYCMVLNDDNDDEKTTIIILLGLHDDLLQKVIEG